MTEKPTNPDTARMAEAIKIAGGIDTVRTLLKSGYAVDQNLYTDWPVTALHLAAHYGRVTIGKLLLAAGADINARDMAKNTPLHKAASNAQIKVVKLLIARGADVKIANASGETPLYHAAANGNLQIVKALVTAGADLSVLPAKGQFEYFIPFEAAVHLWEKEEIDYPAFLADKVAVVTFLAMECGQDPDPQRITAEGRTLGELTNGGKKMEALLLSLKTELAVKAGFADGAESDVESSVVKRTGSMAL